MRLSRQVLSPHICRQVTQGDVSLKLLLTSLRSNLYRIPYERHIKNERQELGLGSFSFYSSYQNRVLRWAGYVARMPMSRAPRQLLAGWVAHPRPIGCPEMNFGRTLKKALIRNDLPTDIETWSTIARDRQRWRLLTHSTPTPSLPTLSPPTPSSPALSPPTPNQPPANPNATLLGYGNLASACVVPIWYAPLAQVQYAETSAAECAARYAARANRANAPPQQHNLVQGIALDN